MLIKGQFTTNDYVFTKDELIVFTKNLKDELNKKLFLHNSFTIEESEESDYYLEVDDNNINSGGTLKTIYAYDFTINLINGKSNIAEFEECLEQALVKADKKNILLDYYLDKG